MSTKFYLYKRSNGVYYIGYFEGSHKRWKSTGKMTKAEALNVLHDIEQHLQKKLPDITLEKFVKQFRQLQAHSFRESTLDEVYRPAFNSFISIIGNKPISQYTLKDVEIYKAKRLEQKCSPTTVNIHFRALRAAFNFAVKWQLLRENPFTASSQIKIAESLPLYLTQEEFQKVLNQTSEQVLKDVFLIAVLTGMRLGEIVNLQWPAVDLQRRQIIVVNSATFQTKTGRIQVLPIADAVYQMLLRRSTEKGWRGYVFHRGFYPLLPDYVSKKFKAYVKVASLNEKLHFHSLRHTFASWLVQDGVSLYEVQKLLGHSNISVTQVYAHLQPERLHSTVNRISIALK